MSEKNYRLYSLYKEMVMFHKVFNGMSFEALGLIRKLSRRINKLHRYCVSYCNDADFRVQLIDNERGKILGIIKLLNREITASNSDSPYCFYVEFSNDPRGNVCKVFIGQNDVNKIGYGIWEILQ